MQLEQQTCSITLQIINRLAKQEETRIIAALSEMALSDINQPYRSHANMYFALTYRHAGDAGRDALTVSSAR